MDRFVVDRTVIEYLLSTDSTFDTTLQILAPTLLRSQVLDDLYRSVGSERLTRAEGLQRHDRFG